MKSSDVIQNCLKEHNIVMMLHDRTRESKLLSLQFALLYSPLVAIKQTSAVTLLLTTRGQFQVRLRNILFIVFFNHSLYSREYKLHFHTFIDFIICFSFFILVPFFFKNITFVLFCYVSFLFIYFLYIFSILYCSPSLYTKCRSTL